MNQVELLTNPDYQAILATIDKEVDYVGIAEHSHKIIGYALREAAEKFGVDVANDLIVEFELEALGWDIVDKEDFI